MKWYQTYLPHWTALDQREDCDLAKRPSLECQPFDLSSVKSQSYLLTINLHLSMPRNFHNTQLPAIGFFETVKPWLLSFVSSAVLHVPKHSCLICCVLGGQLWMPKAHGHFASARWVMQRWSAITPSRTGMTAKPLWRQLNNSRGWNWTNCKTRDLQVRSQPATLVRELIESSLILWHGQRREGAAFDMKTKELIMRLFDGGQSANILSCGRPM